MPRNAKDVRPCLMVSIHKNKKEANASRDRVEALLKEEKLKGSVVIDPHARVDLYVAVEAETLEQLKPVKAALQKAGLLPKETSS